MIKMQLIGDRQLVAKFLAMPHVLYDNLFQSITALMFNLRTKVMSEFLSGPTGAHTLNVISGRLRRSVQAETTGSGTAIHGVVGYGADVPYARIHELGGVIHIPEIVPVTAKALHFMIGGRDVFAMRVRAHDIHMPERAPLRTAFREYTPTIKLELQRAVDDSMRAG